MDLVTSLIHKHIEQINIFNMSRHREDDIYSSLLIILEKYINKYRMHWYYMHWIIICFVWIENISSSSHHILANIPIQQSSIGIHFEIMTSLSLWFVMSFWTIMTKETHHIVDYKIKYVCFICKQYVTNKNNCSCSYMNIQGLQDTNFMEVIFPSTRLFKTDVDFRL